MMEYIVFVFKCIRLHFQVPSTKFEWWFSCLQQMIRKLSVQRERERVKSIGSSHIGPLHLIFRVHPEREGGKNMGKRCKPRRKDEALTLLIFQARCVIFNQARERHCC